MKKSIHAALLPFLSLALVVSALASSLGGSTAANAAIPQAPLLENWTNPVNVSLRGGDSGYDNTTSIGASPVNGSVTVGWERRDYTSADNYTMQASNTSLGGGFNIQEVDYTSPDKASGRVKVKSDNSGRRHMTWWQSDNGNNSCYYARVETDGRVSVKETIPNSSGSAFNFPAIAVGPDNTVHILCGKNDNSIYYYQRSNSGNWPVQREVVPWEARPTDFSIEVSNRGVIMAAWKDLAPGGNSDIFTGVRQGTNNWRVEDISAACCNGCPGNSRSYTPWLAASPDGGIRATWADEQCDPRYEPRETDVYHREWSPDTGWNNKPIVRITNSPGEDYYTALTVDDAGMSHIVWSDDTGRANHDFDFAYSTGAGTNFSAPDKPYSSWSGGAFLKEPSIDYGLGWIHVSFSSNKEDSQKESYYARKEVGGGGPPPTSTSTPLPPTPTATPTPRCPGQRFLDVCPGDTFYTYIMNLVNLGVISGYSDNTFRPNNNLTRGQASKIVALAANLPANLQGSPHFTDVPPTNTFYDYVEYSFNAGVIGGYPCGSPGEPCVAPENKPYFRPNNNITRGQLSKMTSEAFDFNEQVSGQTFTDVPPNNAF
ncbi:MAG: S-layer homology domain-containing protein, partial [Chloroflexia bacterium]